MNEFQGAKGIKPLMELALKLRAGVCLPLTVSERFFDAETMQCPRGLFGNGLLQAMVD